jgi:CDP-diacylglycerol--glycerol-3-phosphate 3-phosphatidyltransferase
MTWTSAFGRGCGVILQAIVNGLALTRISPNVLTFIGLVINTGAAIFFGFANSHNYVRFFLYAGLVIIGAGIFDMVDGRVARQTDQVTVFGAFFDSVIDRYSDVVLFLGLLVFYARGNRFFYVVLTAFVMITSLMVSYTRARSEALIGSCKVGFMERPERVVLIILGALFERWDAMAPALWVLAVLSTLTVIHRISYTYTMAKGLALDVPGSSPQPTPIRQPASPGPVSTTASVSGADQQELLSAPNAPRA